MGVSNLPWIFVYPRKEKIDGIHQEPNEILVTY